MPPMPPDTSGQEPVTVLVVDDDPAMRRLLEKILCEEGYQVVTATGGRQALELAAKAKPQMVLLDVVMPDLDGVATLKALRHQGHAEPVIMLTGHGTFPTARDAMLLGAYDYVTKPFDAEFLKWVLREGLQDHRYRSKEDSSCAR